MSLAAAFFWPWVAVAFAITARWLLIRWIEGQRRRPLDPNHAYPVKTHRQLKETEK